MRTTKGRSLLTFCGFLAIATVFWFLLALNDDVVHDYTIPVELQDFPKEVTILSGANGHVSVNVRDKGSALMRYSFGRVPVLRLRYSDFTSTRDHHLTFSAVQLGNAVRAIFGPSATIGTMRPDSLDIAITTEPGIRVPVRVDADVTTSPKAVRFGAPRVTPDSVTLYSNSHRRFHIGHLSTQPIILSDLGDSVTVAARLIVPDGMRAIPSTVHVSFPVEPLVAKSRSVAVECHNAPDGTRLLTFPSVVEVSYLLPKRFYSEEEVPVKAYVDFRDTHGNGSDIPVSVSILPDYYRNITVTPARVEFLRETR